MDALTTAEKQKLCDFAAAHFGGYGQMIDCGNNVTLSSNEPDQATCVSDAPTNCAMTVSQYEACVNGTSCSNLIPGDCAPLFSCT